jgi:hypothetical protein
LAEGDRCSRGPSFGNDPLTLELARLVADGRMLPEEARFMMLTPEPEESGHDEDDETEQNSASEDEDSSSDTTHFIGEANEDSWNEMEMKQVLHSFSLSRPRPLAWSLDHRSQH